jgi:hypothetical protein
MLEATSDTNGDGSSSSVGCGGSGMGAQPGWHQPPRHFLASIHDHWWPYASSDSCLEPSLAASHPMSTTCFHPFVDCFPDAGMSWLGFMASTTGRYGPNIRRWGTVLSWDKEWRNRRREERKADAGYVAALKGFPLTGEAVTVESCRKAEMYGVRERKGSFKLAVGLLRCMFYITSRWCTLNENLIY